MKILSMCDLKRNKCGQVFTWDLAISISIFLIVLAMLFYMWDSTISKVTATKEIYEAERISMDVTEQLIRTPGVPHDWENQNISNLSVFGLANVEPRILNKNKILKFVNYTNPGHPNYSYARPLIGTNWYEFYFNMTYLNGSQLILNNTVIASGIIPVNSAFELTARRTAVLDDEIVRVYFTVWTNRSYAPVIH